MQKDGLNFRSGKKVFGGPSILKAFKDTLWQFVNISTQKGWNHQQKVPSNLKDQLKEIKIVLDNWGGDPFYQTPNKNCTQILQLWHGEV